jgi:hypothetical protein
MSQVTAQTSKKAPSPQAQESKRIREQIKSLAQQKKDLEAKLKTLAPANEPKRKLVWTDSMKVAKSIAENIRNGTKKADMGEFRSKCAKVVSLKDLKELTLAQVIAVAKEADALMETMPKPTKEPKEGSA